MIEWIERSLAKRDRLDQYVDKENAITVANERDIGIVNPEERVTAFLEVLPALFKWFGENYREFPWRCTQDRWEILVAEILLQRTRAEYVEDLYEDFLRVYPTPESVYRADDEDIFDAVETLGFGNKRTTTLKSLAQAIVEEHEGAIPANLEDLQALPRIGPYTARACLCFADGRALAMVDANVAVVIERVFGYESSTRAHKDQSLYAFLDALIPQDPDLARIFNLSLLDLRSAVCTDPPKCAECPLYDGCLYGQTTYNS